MTKHTKSTKLPNNEDKADFVRDLFNRIAPNYDLMNDLMTGGLHRLWKKKVCKSLDIQAGQKVLDLCCGTGDLTFMLLRENPKAEITGIDFSQEMLAYALERKKKEKHYHAQISFEQGDVMNLPYSDNSFDRLVISFGLRNVSDYEKCLREIYRVAKKGAKFMILDLSHPTGFWDKISGFYRFKLLPLIGKLLAKDYEAYEYLPNSIQIYPNQEKLVELLVKAGWQRVSYENIFGGVVSIHQAEK